MEGDVDFYFIVIFRGGVVSVPSYRGLFTPMADCSVFLLGAPFCHVPQREFELPFALPSPAHLVYRLDQGPLFTH